MRYVWLSANAVPPRRHHFAGAVQVAADRLLDDDAREADAHRPDRGSCPLPSNAQRTAARLAAAPRGNKRGCRECRTAGRWPPSLRLELFIGSGIVEAALHVKEGTSKVGKCASSRGAAGKPIDPFSRPLADILIRIGLVAPSAGSPNATTAKFDGSTPSRLSCKPPATAFAQAKSPAPPKITSVQGCGTSDLAPASVRHLVVTRGGLLRKTVQGSPCQ